MTPINIPTASLIAATRPNARWLYTVVTDKTISRNV